jgi:alpha-tubulin suppressor-like RCC1 family protein
VHKRDPIVAPGFGTQKDLNNLSTSLGLPVPAVQAMMESRGRGIRRRAAGDGDVDDGDEQTQPPAPINNAWADFMMEEGMTVTEEQDEQEPTQTASAAAAAAANSETKTAKTTASSSTSPREYALPLEASWNIKKDLRPKKKLKTTPTSSVLVQTGTLDAGMIGRTKRPLDKPYDLSIPTIISPSLKVTKVIAGCNAAHAICIANDAVVYGWGRNEALQLSQSLPQMVPLPTKLPIEDVTIVDGAVGKFHTILLDSNYKLHAVGSNKCGQCGVNSSVDSVPNIRKCPLDGVNIVQVCFVFDSCTCTLLSLLLLYSLLTYCTNESLARFRVGNNSQWPCRTKVESTPRAVPSLDNSEMAKRESTFYLPTNSPLPMPQPLLFKRHFVMLLEKPHPT